MNNQHVVRVMNQSGMVQRTNSGDLVGMYTLNQMAEVLALHDSIVRPVPTVAVGGEQVDYAKVISEWNAGKIEIVDLTRQRDDANGMVERQATNIEELLRDNEALKAQAASAESERDINYRNWQTAQHEVGVATTLYQTTLAERNKINGHWYEASAKLRNLETSFNSNAIAHSNCLREIEVLKSQLADVTAAWQDAGRMKASFAASYRAAHNEMQRQERRAVDAETTVKLIVGDDVAALIAAMAKRNQQTP